MPDLVCDTSAIQYLHQTGLIRLLRELAENVLIPPAVKLDELQFRLAPHTRDIILRKAGELPE